MASEPTKPLYVRIPVPEADRLDRAAARLRASKRDLVTMLVSHYLDPEGEPRPGAGSRVVTEPDRVTLGHHAFTPAPADDVLTLEEAAGLLRVDVVEVRRLAESGELPARRIGEQWRVARRALLDWLAVS